MNIRNAAYSPLSWSVGYGGQKNSSFKILIFSAGVRKFSGIRRYSYGGEQSAISEENSFNLFLKTIRNLSFFQLLEFTAFIIVHSIFQEINSETSCEMNWKSFFSLDIVDCLPMLKYLWILNLKNSHVKIRVIPVCHFGSMYFGVSINVRHGDVRRDNIILSCFGIFLHKIWFYVC